MSSEEFARAAKLIDVYDEVDGALPPKALAELQALLQWVELDKPEPPPFTWTVRRFYHAWSGPGIISTVLFLHALPTSLNAHVISHGLVFCSCLRSLWMALTSAGTR